MLGVTYDGSKIKITARISKARNYLSHTGEHFSKIIIDISGSRDQIEGYFGVLLDEKHTNCNISVLLGGSFINTVLKKHRNINFLDLVDISIDERALPKLSRDFPKFHVLLLRSCTFKNSKGYSTKNVTITMEDTIVEKLIIFKHPIISSVLLISVVSYEEDISKYYVSYASTKSTLDEINKIKFDTLRKALKDDETASISIHLKSVSHIRINTQATSLPGKGYRHKIDISL